MTLAFLGDAVYELAVRRVLIERGGIYAADKLHRAAVRYVRASAQAKALRGILKAMDCGAVPAMTEGSDVSSFVGLTGESTSIILDEEALTVCRRARNHKPKTVPKNADPLEYKMATALEALIGYLSLEGRDEEVQALIDLSMQIIDSKE